MKLTKIVRAIMAIVCVVIFAHQPLIHAKGTAAATSQPQASAKQAVEGSEQTKEQVIIAVLTEKYDAAEAALDETMKQVRERALAGKISADTAAEKIKNENAKVVKIEQNLKDLIKKAKEESEESAQEGYLSYITSGFKGALNSIKSLYEYSEQEKETAELMIKRLRDQREKLTIDYGVLDADAADDSAKKELEKNYTAIIAQLDATIDEQRIIAGQMMSPTKKRLAMGALGLGAATAGILASGYLTSEEKAGLTLPVTQLSITQGTQQPTGTQPSTITQQLPEKETAESKSQLPQPLITDVTTQVNAGEPEKKETWFDRGKNWLLGKGNQLAEESENFMEEDQGNQADQAMTIPAQVETQLPINIGSKNDENRDVQTVEQGSRIGDIGAAAWDKLNTWWSGKKGKLTEEAGKFVEEGQVHQANQATIEPKSASKITLKPAQIPTPEIVRVPVPELPKEEPTIPKEEPTIPKEEPTIPKEEPTIPKEEPTIPKEEPTIPKEEPTIPKEEPTIPKEEPTIPKEEPTIPKEEPTIPKEEPTIPKEEPTIPKEEPTIPKEEPTIPKEEPTIPKEEPTIPKEEPTLPKEEPTLTKEEPALIKEESKVAAADKVKTVYEDGTVRYIGKGNPLDRLIAQSERAKLRSDFESGALEKKLNKLNNDRDAAQKTFKAAEAKWSKQPEKTRNDANAVVTSTKNKKEVALTTAELAAEKAQIQYNTDKARLAELNQYKLD